MTTSFSGCGRFTVARTQSFCVGFPAAFTRSSPSRRFALRPPKQKRSGGAEALGLKSKHR